MYAQIVCRNECMCRAVNDIFTQIISNYHGENLKASVCSGAKVITIFVWGGGVIGIVTFIDKEGETYLLYLDKQMTFKKKWPPHT